MAWPSSIVSFPGGGVKTAFGPDAVGDGQARYDDGYAAGLAAGGGGGGGSSAPTTGQLWPR